MDNKSLEMLEFPQIREILARFTSFSVSREMALNLQPLGDYEQLSLLLKQSAEARHLLSLAPDFDVGNIFDIRETAILAARGKVLEPQTLTQVQQTLVSSRLVKSHIREFDPELPLLRHITDGIVEIPSLEKDIANCVTPSGELRDDASPRLIEIRRQLKQVHQQLIEQLQIIIESTKGQKIIQEPIISQREGRYVIPVKAEARKEINGLVHDVSNTGATVFVEPWAVVDTGNTLREVKAEEKREIERILSELSAQVGVYEHEICRNISLIAELDLAVAKARYAQKIKATEPSLINHGDDAKSNSRLLRLVNARHPLIGEKAVPLTLEMGRDFLILIITGPNTGGKTVALKTAGLLSLMAQAGIPIPAAAESVIPVFDNVFADIGDEQSIAQTLSTFSWHVGNIVRIINQATDKSLVLLDELGTSTDPSEGSALARSILLHFLSQETMTVATTHYSELKAFAHTTSGMQNASLDFDPETLAPTYHLTVGIPGGSNALATASRLGLSEKIIADARTMLSRGAQELEALLNSLTVEKREIDSLRQAAQKERSELEQLNNELRNELQALKMEEERLIREASDKVILEAAELHREIKQALSDLRKEKTRERIEQTKKVLTSVHKRLDSGVWQAGSSRQADTEPDSWRIAVGDRVKLRDVSLEATVLSISEEAQEVEVQAGQTKIRLSLLGVEKINPPAKTPESKPVVIPVAHAVPLKLDLRGKRADEVEFALDSYLNQASLANLNEVCIVHGLGTGAVRKIVRELLSTHPLVKSFRPGERGEGGDGATIVKL